jgi:hypothetical protein
MTLIFHEGRLVVASLCEGGRTFPVLSFQVGKDQMSEPAARIKLGRVRPCICVKMGLELATGGGGFAAVVAVEM